MAVHVREKDRHGHVHLRNGQYWAKPNMAYLKLPSRVPLYRLERDHTDFVCRMKEFIERSVFLEKTIMALGTQFTLKELNMDEVDDSCWEHLQSNRLLTINELKDTARIDSISQAL